MRILHIADLHLRGFTRHDEVRAVIEDLVEKANKLAVDRIIIAGDIFHTKLQGITGEYIDLLRWMLLHLASVAPVDVTLGNHDFAQNNLTRQDSVSPIVKALNDDRIKLYKQSENVYLNAAFNLGVFSIFDTEGYSNVVPHDEFVNIAIFHGSVAGAKTEDGWALEGEVDLSFFKGWDFVLLGDIHKHQFLGYREDFEGTRKPWIGYPGSLLQNTYAEDLEHGFLLWDIKSKDAWDVEWHQLINPKPFVTLEWNEDPHDIVNVARKFPKHSRFRIKSVNQLLQKDVRSITNILSKKRAASEIVFKAENVIQTTHDIAKKLTSIDMRSAKNLAKLISEDTHFELNSAEMKEIQNLLEGYVKAIPNIEGVTRNVKWNVSKLKFDNLFCYGEDNIVDFGLLKGIIGIFGPNRLGKSSILGALLYGMFNTTDRGPVKNADVCNIRKQFCSAEIEFSTGYDKFLIQRQTTKQETKKGGIYSPTQLNFFKLESDEKIDMCGEQRNDTEKNIKNVVGSSEDFLLTSIASQGDINSFISHGSTKRKQILTRFLDLDFFEKLHDVAKQECNAINSQLKVCVIHDDWEQVLINLKNRELNYKDWLETNDVFVSELRKTIEIQTRELIELRSKLQVTQSDIDGQQRHVKAIRVQVANIKSQLSNYDIEAKNHADKLAQVVENLMNYDIKSLKEQLTKIQTLQFDFRRNEASLAAEKQKLEPVKKSLRLLEEVPCGDQFPSCKFIKDAHSNKLFLNPINQKIAELQEVFEKSREVLEFALKDEVEKKIEKFEKYQSLKNALEQSILKNTNLKTTNTHRLENLERELAEEEKSLNDLTSSYVSDAEEKVHEVVSRINVLKHQLSLLEKDKLTYAREEGKIVNTIQKLHSDREIFETLSKKLHSAELIAKSFSKKGIPSKILKTQLPAINHEISKILNGVVDFSIELAVDDVTDSMDIFINYGDSRRLIELGSGMEKTICSIAVRAALVTVSTLPKTDMFVLDESFDALDANSIEACARLLQVLKTYFDTIIVITHLDGIKDAVDQVIEIKHDGKNSTVTIQ